MRLLIALFVGVLVSSCTAHKEIPLKDNVSKTKTLRITVGMEETRMLSDNQNFDRVKAFVAKQEPQWGQPLGTFPTPQVTVAFLDSTDNLLFPLWIGPNWIGTRYKNDSFLKNIPKSEIDSLKTLLGQ